MNKDFSEHELQILIGNLLRWGVFISMGIVIVGVLLFLVQKGGHPTDFTVFDSSKVFDTNAFFSGLAAFKSEAVITLGVICLILTPVLRVVFAIIGFAMEKDRMYVIISTIVLLVIISSIFIGATE